MDTDGGPYWHQYRVGKKTYRYLKLCFTNYSKPLLDFVHDTLKNLRYRAYLTGSHVSIYSEADVKRYFTEIGSNNSKHVNQFKRLCSKKVWRDAGVAERNRLLSG